jgi:uncharacterized repeat protein (TIGR01451 family)
MTARSVIFVLLLAAVPAGCSYNPGYFPYTIPGGPITQDHAKPSGPGYFKNFDPKACKLDVTPDGIVTAPLGASIVLVGTVSDKDGTPRRSRRIEWVVDGPGNIIEVDESGFYPGRGYKVDNKYAVSYTNYFTKNFTRGNADPRSDVTISPGQTFCVLSCAVPGETVVTAYAPEVFNWDNGRVVVKIQWGDGRFVFPSSATIRAGSEYSLTTTINNGNATGPDTTTSGYRVRYRVIDGPPTVLVSKSGQTSAPLPNGNSGQVIETAIDANGVATVQLVERDRKTGKSRVTVEVVKPADNGNGQEVVVARRDTVIEWADPKVHLSVNAPKVASVNGNYPVTISLENDSGAESRDAQVKVTLSDGATMAHSEPPPLKQDANGALYFAVPPVGGKTNQTVVLQVKPAGLGNVTVIADAVTTDGMQASHKATTRIDQGRLQLNVQAPTAALTGEPIPFKLAVTNTGAAPAQNVNIWAQFDAGLTYPSPQNPVELAVGTLDPGQTKTLDLPLTAKATGHFNVRASATGDGNLTVKADPVGVDVQRAELTATATGPTIAYLNNDFDWSVTVNNAADLSVSNVSVRATIPPEVLAKSASDGGKVGAGSVEWLLPELKPREQKTFKLTVSTTKLTARAAFTVAVMADAINGTQLVGDPLGAKAETVVAIIGTPALVLNVAAPPASVEVGKRVTFKITVKNQGTVSARTIEVAGYAPPQLKPTMGTGPVEGRIDTTGKITFPAVDELQPGATLTFTVEVEGSQVGDARFRAEVKAAHLTKVLQEEQTTRVTAK